MSRTDVAVIDYGMGNILSVQRGLEHCGATVTVTSDPDIIFLASRVILPGVGAFSNAMAELTRLRLDTVVREVGASGRPLMGICLGMQMLFDESAEFGQTTGLGLIPGRVVSLPNKTISGERQKIPHIGWSELELAPVREEGQAQLLQWLKSGDAAYFVHSFMANPTNMGDRVADCIYGGHLVSAVIMRDNIIGCQFHPEKSGEVGLNMLREFLLL